DRAGGGEGALEQGEVAQVQVERAAHVAGLERPDQLLEGGPAQVREHAHHADTADGEQRQQVLVVAGVLLHRPAGVAPQAAGGGHVPGRVLDRHDVVVPLEQPEQGRHLDQAGGARRDVVEHAGPVGGPGDGREVGDQPLLRGPVVVGGDQEQGADTGLLGQGGQLDRLGGGGGGGGRPWP